jgi:hypothetical protein
MSFHFSRRKFIDGAGVLAASSILSPPRLRFGSVHVAAPMKPEELRARLRGGIAFPLCLSKILFSGFHQCNIVTLRSKLATISIRRDRQAGFHSWISRLRLGR